jgi:hypothetical protein
LELFVASNVPDNSWSRNPIFKFWPPQPSFDDNQHLPHHFFASFLVPSFFTPFPRNISRCPAFSPNIFSVFAVNPAEALRLILLAAMRDGFLGLITREPRGVCEVDGL